MRTATSRMQPDYSRQILLKDVGTAGQAILAASRVLIVGADSKVDQLDSLQVRKLFLGMTVTHDGDRLRPLLNVADSRVRDIFLQNIVSMTDMTYDRRILRLALQGGEVRHDFTLSGYVFFPKGSYHEVEFLLINQETGDTEVMREPWR